MKNNLVQCFSAVAMLGLSATAAQAATLIGSFSGNDCGAGGFSNCYAYQTGTTNTGVTGPGGSPTIFKYNNGGATDKSTLFPSITGSEFNVSFASGVLSFTYNPGAGDPQIHYYSVKQGNAFNLYYDALPILSGSVAIRDYSHITFFDTGGGGSTNPPGGVPEPTTWLMMIVGFGFIAGTMRARGRKQVSKATFNFA